MSDTTGGPDVREQLARLDRGIAETQKLREEIRKFVAEGNATKARWEPWKVLLSALAGLGVFLAFLFSHLPIPTKPFKEMIPPGAPRLLAEEVFPLTGFRVKPVGTESPPP